MIVTGWESLNKVRTSSDGNVGELARVLAIIYGFFFVFLSAFLGSVPWIMTLDDSLIFRAYALLWLMSFSIVLIGSALANILENLGLGTLGGIGLFVLNVALPVSYLYFVGDVIAFDIPELRFFGPVVFYIAIAIVLIVLAFQYRRRKGKLEAAAEELKERVEKFASLLIQMIPEAENPEAILRLLETLKELPFIATDDGVRKAIVKTVGSLDSKEKVIKEIEGFPELMESDEIREMVERAKKTQG